MTSILKAPFPYEGGKTTPAPEIWTRLGNPDNFVEPFCGSAAVLLARPHNVDDKTETCNDLDGFITNVYRSIEDDPEATAYYCDRPVNEIDLTAIHLWLKSQRDDLTSHLFADIDYYDPKAAGRWLYGKASWIGDGWCVADGPWINVDGRLVDRRTLPEEEQVEGVRKKMPDVSPNGIGRGVGGYRNAPGVPRKMPEVGAGDVEGGGYKSVRGIQRYRNAPGVPRKMPEIGRSPNGQIGFNRKGIQAHRYREGVPKQMPVVSAGNVKGGGYAFDQGVQYQRRASSAALLAYFARLAARLRRVRFLCGDWSRCVKDSITVNHGLTGLLLDPDQLVGVLLDPPYPPAEHGMRYHGENAHVWYAAAAWAVEHGDDPRLRIAVCGYHSEAADALFPDTWTRYRWEARGGYSNQSKNGRGRDNAKRECVWFNASCLNPADEARAAFSQPIVAGESDYAGTLFEEE